MIRFKTHFIPVVLLFCAGCDSTISTPANPASDFVTATLPATVTPALTHTPAPVAPPPTIAPISGATTTEVNVRADTSTASQALGTIPPFSTVQIIGKDASGLWFRIVFGSGAGWVRADYVQAADAAAEIPIVEAGSGAGSGARGVVLRGVNIRSGPGRDFDSLGFLNQYDVVAVFGKDASGAWMQVEYPPAPDGKGWVAAEFLQVENAGAIQILDSETQTAETEPSAIPESATPAIAARMDGDSADAPLAMFTLSFDSARSVHFRGEVSSGGDLEDWIGFTPSAAQIVIQLLCPFGVVQVELSQIPGAPIECGGARAIQTVPNQTYRLKVSPVPLGDGSLAKYELRISIGD